MLERSKPVSLGQLALPPARRTPPGTLFARLFAWSDGAKEGLWRFHERARRRGVILEGRIGNPDERQVAYLEQTLGPAFEPTAAFAEAALARWMPRMGQAQRRAFAGALAEQYRELERRGKPQGVLRNLYIKMMCWLYYRFERLMPLLEGGEPPAVLVVSGDITGHELSMLRALAALGVDILLAEPRGDDAYARLDPEDRWSRPVAVEGGAPFPGDFSLKALRGEMEQREAANPAAKGPVNRPMNNVPNGNRPMNANPAANRPMNANPAANRPMNADPAANRPAQTVPNGNRPTPVVPNANRPAPSSGPVNRPMNPNGNRPANVGPTTARGQAVDPTRYFQPPQRRRCTNVWMKEAELEQVLTPPERRGDDPGLFYNAFVRLAGVKDPMGYVGELHRFYQRLLSAGRAAAAVDGPMPRPDPRELSEIRRRGRYASSGELIVDLAGNLPAGGREELHRLMQAAFVEVLQDAAGREPNLNRLLAAAAGLLCRIRRYHGQLFKGWRSGDVPAFILMGGCADGEDALYVRWLARLPVDVVLLAPDLEKPCACADDTLLELRGEDSLPVTRFPRDDATLQMSTMAAHAERDLDALLYADSGLYRRGQFARGNAVTLRTTYDELFILWDQELRYRPGFSADGGAATLPVLYAKVSGVEGGRLPEYWQRVKRLAGGDALYFPRLPMDAGDGGAHQALALKALRGGRLRREALKGDRSYPFAMLREELQEHMLDKLQLMLDRRLIRGTWVNGTEYTVVATVLGLGKEVLRRLQAFDFTRANPKVVCVHTREQGATLQDAITLCFLNLVGFDVALFVPTGYQTVERFMADNLPVEHRTGDFVYDLEVPDLDALPAPRGPSWINRLLNRH